MAQNISDTNSFTTNFEVGVPSQTDEANIVRAFTEYHYGANYNGTGDPGGIEGHLKNISDTLDTVVNTSFNQQTSSYTISLSDKNKIIEINSSSPTNITVPTNAVAGFEVGSTVNILQTGSGQVTVVGSGGVTVNATPGLKLRTQWSFATLIKRATNTWILVGDTSA